jgi:hypothetical protein
MVFGQVGPSTCPPAAALLALVGLDVRPLPGAALTRRLFLVFFLCPVGRHRYGARTVAAGRSQV